MLHTCLDYPLLAGGNSLKRFGQSIKRIVREVEEQNTGQAAQFCLFDDIVNSKSFLRLLCFKIS